jgi:hypothetical protein
MPAMMMHLAVARAVKPNADGMFFFGNMAPDYIDARDIKDIIHLRNREDRWDALAELRGKIDMTQPFDEGWLLHLFADARWDENVIPHFRDSYVGDDYWFHAYRHALGRASFRLFHNQPWSAEVWEKINSAPIEDLRTSLPVPLELTWYRERVYKRHSEGVSEPSPYFPEDMVLKFADETAKLYKDWMK